MNVALTNGTLIFFFLSGCDYVGTKLQSNLFSLDAHSAPGVTQGSNDRGSTFIPRKQYMRFISPPFYGGMMDLPRPLPFSRGSPYALSRREQASKLLVSPYQRYDLGMATTYGLKT